MTWFQGSLLSFLSVKAPSVKTPLQILYNQLTKSAARSRLLICLLIHSLSTLIKTYYIGHPDFRPPTIHKRFPDCPGEHPPSLILSPCALGGAEPNPASSGGAGIWSRMAHQSIALAWPQGLVQGGASYPEKTNQKQWDSILRLLLNCWESGLFFLLLKLLTAILLPQSKKKWWAALRHGENCISFRKTI